jgi:hypothetical protein
VSATGIAFRSVDTFVTNVAGDTFCIDDTWTGAPIRAGETFGWDIGPTAEDLDNTVDPRVAGDNFYSHVNGDDRVWKWSKANGTYAIRGAFGGVGVTNFPNLEFRDGVGGTVLFTVQDAAGSAAGEFYDVTGVKRATAAAWVSNNASRLITLTSGLLVVNVKYLSPLGGGRNALSYISLVPAGGTPPMFRGV